VKDLGVTYEDLRAAAEMLRRYARAVETHLYINMKIPAAHHEISEAYRVADELDGAAAQMDTVPPAQA
jgi:hypothetical protein